MKWLLTILLLLTCMSAGAASRITATITVTNTPAATNTITVNANVRTWTNSAVASPSTLILIGGDRLISATNLANQIFGTPYAGPIAASFTQGSNIVLVGQVDQAMAVSFYGSYARVAYSTQAVALSYTVRVPVASEPLASQRTNVASDLVNAFNIYGTNALNQNSIVSSNLMGLTNVQTIGVLGTKTWLNVNYFTNSFWERGFLTNATVGLLTGQLTNTDNLGIRITNGYATGLNLGLMTNGLWTNAILRSPKMTNAINYGNAFSSPGIGAGSEQFGSGARATNASTLAIGFNAHAYGDGSLVIGTSASADADAPNSIVVGPSGLISASDYSMAIGTGAQVSTSENALAIGRGASVSASTNSAAIGPLASVNGFDESIAIGYGAVAVAHNQILLGGTGIDTYVQNVLQVAGATTNLTIAGTNRVTGQLSFLSAARTSLANGNNSGIVLGTNVYVRLSGASTVANIAGFAAEPDGSWHIVQITGSITNNILTESGVDPVAANRIVTGTGGTVIMTNSPGILEIIYDATAARWRIIKASN